MLTLSSIQTTVAKNDRSTQIARNPIRTVLVKFKTPKIRRAKHALHCFIGFSLT